MGKKKRGCLSKIKIFTFFSLLMTGVILTGIAFLNLSLPKKSPIVDKLTVEEQNRLAEITHLRKTLGNKVWPGWGGQETPILVYNEAYAFLYGMDKPTPGWIRVPYNIPEAGEWEQVNSQYTYHRQPLPKTGETPQAFIVEIGKKFVASMTTKDWTQIHLVNMIKEDLPGFLKPIIPYSLFIYKFDSDWHVAGILHESFHAFQADQAYDRVQAAERATLRHNAYPWDDVVFREIWVKERHMLAKAVNSKSKKELRKNTEAWLKLRNNRRSRLDSSLIRFEKQREWLEGLAKYAEINIWMLASDRSTYTPLPVMVQDPDFSYYQEAVNHRKQEIRQLQSNLGFSESMFYYSGWAQAEMLDRLYPDWKSRAFEPDVFLDELLKEVCVTDSTPILSSNNRSDSAFKFMP